MNAQENTTLTLPKWVDLHAHLRQEPMLAPLIEAQISMGCRGTLAMPNTKPPLAKVLEADPLPYGSVESYLGRIRAIAGDRMPEVIVPLYLTKDTTPKMIEDGAKSGILRACKYYPPHGTTGADFACGLETFMENGVIEAIEETGLVLCAHGEEHILGDADFFDRNRNAEILFYTNRAPRLLDACPDLKFVAEHMTTRTACDFVKKAGPNVAASITPQHLLYTISDLLKGCKYHLYCMPLLKFEDDRAALREAVTSADNGKFFAGTDSAPHTTKATECGCAAGCFTGGYAPQLYAQAFEEAGCALESLENQQIFRQFLCTNGPEFYALPAAADGETFTLTRTPRKVEMLEIPGAGAVTPLPLGTKRDTLPWSVAV